MVVVAYHATHEVIIFIIPNGHQVLRNISVEIALTIVQLTLKKLPPLFFFGLNALLLLRKGKHEAIYNRKIRAVKTETQHYGLMHSEKPSIVHITLIDFIYVILSLHDVIHHNAGAHKCDH